MIFKYGTYSHPANECLIAAFIERRQYNSRGKAQTKIRRMVVQGEIIADGQAAIDARVAQIQANYLLEGSTAVFLRDDLTPTHYEIDGTSARSVRILDLSFQQQDGKAHFATGLPFTITIEGEYGITDLDTLVSYTETIGYIGTGGPRRVLVECDNVIPQEQIVSNNTAVTVIQSGSAVGSLTYPLFNGPIFPTQIDNPDGYQQFKSAPRADGKVFVDWPIRWNYRMTFPFFPASIDPTRK